MEDLYRAAVRGRGVYWSARCRTYLGNTVTLYAATPGELVRALQSDAWCQCIKAVLALQELHETQEARCAVA